MYLALRGTLSKINYKSLFQSMERLRTLNTLMVLVKIRSEVVGKEAKISNRIRDSHTVL